MLKDSIGRPLYLYYEQIWTPNHSFAITVYSKFWIINYTEFNMTLYNSKDNIASGQSIGQVSREEKDVTNGTVTLHLRQCIGRAPEKYLRLRSDVVR